MLDTVSLYQLIQAPGKQKTERKGITMNRNEITLGIIPVSVRTTIKTDAKGNDTTKTAYDKWALVGYYVRDGKQVRAPFAGIQNFCGMARENIVTVGSRDKLMAVAYVLSAMGFRLKPYIKGGAADAVARLKASAEKAVQRAEKTIADGKEAYLETVKANGEKAWDAMPNRLTDKKEVVNKLDGILALIRK